MKNSISIVIFTLISVLGFGQQDFNIELQSHVDFNEVGSSIWGFTDSNGIEYAVMGTQFATRILSLEDPKNPIPRHTTYGPNTLWREMKYYNNHVYVATDAANVGLTIIDCSGAPLNFTDTIVKPFITVNGVSDTLRSIHDIYIDEAGILYLSGHNISKRGVLMFDLKPDPKNPVYLGAVDPYYSHDAIAINDTLYTSDLNNGFSIYDIKDKANPILLGKGHSSSNFTHNMWPSDDRKYLFTTDERAFGWVDAYDISNLPEIVFLDRFRPLETISKRTIPHNTHHLNGYNVTSWYTEGIMIIDGSRPTNLVKVGSYDTYFKENTLPQNGNWFEGVWGVYPYFPSGTTIASDRNTGLYVFKPTYVRASYLEGKATFKNPETGEISNLQDVAVNIAASQIAFDTTNFEGNYATGLAQSGSFTVTATHAEYGTITKTVNLQSGAVTICDFEFTIPKLSVNVFGTDLTTSLTGAIIRLTDLETLQDTTHIVTDTSFVLTVLGGGKYEMYVSKWGYLPTYDTLIILPNTDFSIDITLEPGYYDAFETDLGWSIQNTATEGNWVRSNNPIEPITDSDDYGKYCYITGQAVQDSTGIIYNELDGTTTITSPLITLKPTDNTVTFSLNYYFSLAIEHEDLFNISATNGLDTLNLVNLPENGEWASYSGSIHSDVLDMSNGVQLIFKAHDAIDSNFTKVALDQFQASTSFTINATNITEVATIKVRPTLIDESFIVENTGNSAQQITLSNIQGQSMKAFTLQPKETMNVGTSTLQRGMYFVSNNLGSVVKIIVR